MPVEVQVPPLGEAFCSKRAVKEQAPVLDMESQLATIHVPHHSASTRLEVRVQGRVGIEPHEDVGTK